MADNLGSNPMKIESASATAKTTDRLKIRRIVWENPTTDADSCVVQNKDGNQIVKFDPAIAGYNQEFSLGSDGQWFKGLLVPTLDSGTLWVYLD